MEMFSSQMCKYALSEQCIKAIEKFQCTMIEKDSYLAFHIRKTITMSFDAMAISPIESMTRVGWVSILIHKQGELKKNLSFMNSFFT